MFFSFAQLIDGLVRVQLVSDQFTDTRPRGSSKRRVLLVDDSPFFRNMLAPLLGVAGYQVKTAEDAQSALRLCEAGERFDIIIETIDVLRINSFEAAIKIFNEKYGICD